MEKGRRSVLHEGPSIAEPVNTLVHGCRP